MILAASVATATPVLATDDSSTADAHRLFSHGPIGFTGTVGAELRDGSLHARGHPLLGTTTLDAGQIKVEIRWEEGVRVGQDPSLTRRVTDAGHKERILDGATVHLLEGRATATDQPDQASPRVPEILGLPEALGSQSAYASTLHLMDAADLKAWEKPSGTVVRAGPSEESQGSPGANPARYVHEIEEPVVWLTTTTGDARVEGDLEVFVNNVTLEAIDQDGETWSTWAGYRESDPGQQVSRYEQQVVVLHAAGARLSVGAAQEVRLFGSEAIVGVDGIISSEAVSGRLSLGPGEGLRVYETARLMVEGILEVELASGHEATPGSAAGQGSTGLAFQVDGEPDVLATDEGRVVQARTGGVTGPRGSWLGTLAIGVGVVIIGFTGVVAARRGWLGLQPPLARWREDRYRGYMADGRRAADEEDWEAAAHAYGEAVQTDPEEALAWFMWGLALVEAKEFDRCLEILPDAASAPGMDPWDLLYLRATAAWGAGRDAIAASTLEQMIDQDPAMTRQIVDRLGIDLDELSPGLADRLDRVLAWRQGPRHPLGGELDGYI